MSTTPDDHYRRAVDSLARTLGHLRGCTAEERALLTRELANLETMEAKLAAGRLEIVVFGEISTGKSALINALVGAQVAAVNVRGGWTKEINRAGWQSAEYRIPGLQNSEVLLVDTPGLNEVGGSQRGELAAEAARAADLILFVTDSDLNEIEYAALLALKSVHKPLIVVLNKIDLYSRAEQARLMEILRDDRLKNIIEPENFVATKANPREYERIVEGADGSERSEWIKPSPDVTQLKERILQVLEKEGLALLALNAALYAADHSDRITSLRLQLRETKANAIIASYASLKAIAVGCNPMAVADMLGGLSADILLVATLAKVYGMELSWMHARALVTSILKSSGWTLLAVSTMHSMFKLVTAGWGTVLTAIPQGLAAGYGSYIVGQAAKYYFEHGGSWGSEGPKQVVREILATTDRESVLEKLKHDIEKKIQWNRHAASGSGE